MEIIKTSWPNVYSCNFIEQGLVAYDNKEVDSGKEILYVPKETLDRMLVSMIGKPVCIKHQKINPENYEELRKKGVIVGNVIRAWFNPSDGWFWCDFLVDIQAGRDRIDQEKDSVSCAYAVLDAKEGGIWHDIKYDGEVTDGEFTHLALVDSPRYEGAKITKQIPAMLVNEKSAHLFNNKEDYMNLKDLLFRKKPDGSKEKLEGVIVINGKDVDLGEFLGTLIEKINEKPASKTVNLEDVLMVNGKELTVRKLVEMAVANEKKNCDCGMKDGEEHGKDCPMFEKKNAGEDEAEELKTKAAEEKAKENARLNAKAKELGKTVDEVVAMEAAEKNNSKDPASLKRIQELETENALLKKNKQGQEFFNELETLANSVLNEPVKDASIPASRQERANKKSAQVKAQFASTGK